MKYDFNTQRTLDKVQININKWLNPCNSIEIYKMNGKPSITCITKATFVGKGVDDIRENDSLLLTKVSCEVATSLTAFYTLDDNKYFDVPKEQILGIFKGDISLSTLEMTENNILFEKINKFQNSTLLIEEKNTTLGKILKTGKNSSFKIGDVVAIMDNVSTQVFLDGNEYFAAEGKFVVGVFQEDLLIENAKIVNNFILMKPYIPSHVLNSTMLETPEIDYNSLDYSDISNRNLFKVAYCDGTLKNIEKENILLIERNYTNYVYYGGEKYFAINDIKWVSGKIIERDK